MEVLNVSWDSIPKKDHNHILEVIPIGGYVKSLPVINADQYPVYKFAVLGKLRDIKIMNITDVSVCETEILTFIRIPAVNANGERGYIWKKE
ncbi:MAG: hypothetical protein IMZ70_07720 [Candidatus Atribacteria bacterium]|nr:hypothetical protein [Candidatus Atribacteria bacterium]